MSKRRKSSSRGKQRGRSRVRRMDAPRNIRHQVTRSGSLDLPLSMAIKPKSMNVSQTRVSKKPHATINNIKPVIASFGCISERQRVRRAYFSAGKPHAGKGSKPGLKRDRFSVTQQCRRK